VRTQDGHTPKMPRLAGPRSCAVVVALWCLSAMGLLAAESKLTGDLFVTMQSGDVKRGADVLVAVVPASRAFLDEWEQVQSGYEQEVASVVAAPNLTRADVIRARRQYKVEVLAFDASQKFGTKSPYADFVRLRISNKSDVTLPCLTILTKRYSKNQMVGASRAPSIPTTDLAPGESVEYNYYPLGHLDLVRVDKIAVEVEGIINPNAERFFCELQAVKR
jgi:hypothetical protein